MVQYCYTALYELARPLCVYKARVRSYALEHNEKHNELLPHSTARSTRVLEAYFILEWSYFFQLVVKLKFID